MIRWLFMGRDVTCERCGGAMYNPAPRQEICARCWTAIALTMRPRSDSLLQGARTPRKVGGRQYGPAPGKAVAL